jgi:hypothetical protein
MLTMAWIPTNKAKAIAAALRIEERVSDEAFNQPTSAAKEQRTSVIIGTPTMIRMRFHHMSC